MVVSIAAILLKECPETPRAEAPGPSEAREKAARESKGAGMKITLYLKGSVVKIHPTPPFHIKLIF